ncbi:MAG: glycosyltransferase [Arhodomonas sp.]|nr:glycosyltransferase [Arhodomonas sp.]
MDIANVPAQRLHVIRNPIVNPMLREKAGASLDHPWFAPGEPPVILGVGSLEPRKDFPTLMRAFARVREQRTCRLIILGKGSEEEALRSLARDLGLEEAVSLPGFDTNPYRYMSRAAVLALSSRREGASAVIVEALACGTPVVSTDCPSGPAEILDGVTPRALVPVGDAEALGEALLAMLRNPPPSETLQALTHPPMTELRRRAYLQALLADAEGGQSGRDL